MAYVSIWKLGSLRKHYKSHIYTMLIVGGMLGGMVGSMNLGKYLKNRVKGRPELYHQEMDDYLYHKVLVAEKQKRQPAA